MLLGETEDLIGFQLQTNYLGRKYMITNEYLEENGLEHLNISYNKTEIEMLIKAHDKYCSVEETILLNKSLKERIKECISFISKWRYHQKDFIEMLKINNGLIR